MTKIAVAGTGHRPNKLGGEYDLKGPVTQAIVLELASFFADLEKRNYEPVVISGMALGFDMILAVCALNAGYPLIAAVPFKGQESKWPARSQKLYNTIISRASAVHTICEDGYAAWKMQKRNEWMVNNADVVVACWDGTEGGTANCYRYAESKNKSIFRINPKELI